MKTTRHLTTLVCATLATLGLIATATAAPFEISTTVLNADTQQTQNSFHPGDHIALMLTADLPPSAKNKKLHLSVSAKASAYGFQFPVRLLGNSSIANDFSIIDPSKGGPLVQSGDEEIRFTIPKEAPTGTLEVTIKANIKTVGQAKSVTVIPVVRP